MGVTAQDARTDATLLENSAGICSASVTAHDFGDFEWTGSAYEGDFTGSFQIQTTQTISPDPVSCDYTFTGTSLTLEGSDDIISADAIDVTSGVDTVSAALSGTSSFTESVATGVGTAHPIEYNLEAAMSSQTPGDYVGSVTVTVVGETTPGE